MPHDSEKPRILFVTPEVSYLPEKMSAMSTSLRARAGELADLIHCNDWMTGLIQAMARRLEIPCLFTIHNIYNGKALLSSIEGHEVL
jgi:hypothetical protein